MNRTLAALMLVSSLVPAVAAQQAVDRCSQQCSPRDRDVNEPPLQTDDDVSVILYAHPYQSLLYELLNLQPPDPIHEGDVTQSFLLPHVKTETGTPADVGFDGNHYSFLPTPSPITFQPDGTRFQHPIYCFTQLELSRTPLVLYAYFSAEVLAGDAGVLGAGAVPLFQVEAWWETGRHRGLGAVLAEGSSDAFHVINRPGAPALYEVRVELEQTGNPHAFCRAAAEAGSVFVVHATQVDSEGNEALQRELRPQHGSDHPWRVILPVVRPLQTASMLTTHEDEAVRVTWTINASLGSYDVDAGSLRLDLLGADGTVVGSLHPATLLHSLDHDGILKPVKAGWAVPASTLRDLDVTTMRATAQNLQGTYQLREFVDPPADALQAPSSMPGFEGVLLLAGLAGLAWTRRRP